MNKNELVNFLLEHQELSWEISGKVEEVLLRAIDEFFDLYQPERLNPEDQLSGISGQLVCDSLSTTNK